MAFDNEITIRLPAPSDGIETVLVLLGFGAVLVAVLGILRHREKIISWLGAHPFRNAAKPVNLLSWVALAGAGPVAALLFVRAVNEAFTFLGSDAASNVAGGSFGRGAVIVALIGAPFVIWRSIVAQKSVNVTQQGHITDRINKAVELLGHAEPAVRMGGVLSFDRIMADSAVDRVMVLKMLNAYITYHQPATTEPANDVVQDTSIDVQAALDVLFKWRG